MVENGYNKEITGLISLFRRTVLYGKEDPETLKNAWRTYLEIKEKNFRPEPTSPEELKNIRKTVEIMEKGGIPEHIYPTYAAYYSLRVDFGMFGTRGLIGDLRDEEKKKASSFAKGMLGVLIESEK